MGSSGGRRPSRFVRAGGGLGALLLTLVLAPSALANTFTVTTNADSGTGSLRDAITQSNGLGGLNTIDFDLQAPLSNEIHVQSSLPVITTATTIDGGGLIQLDGLAVGFDEALVGLEFAPGSGASVVRGLTITRFSQYGLILRDNPVLVVGNTIGTDAAGDTGLGVGTGIYATGAATIGGTTAASRNVISGNSVGLALNGTGTIVEGDYIGTDPSGTKAVPNNQGIFLDPGTNVTVGGATAGAGNVISGNTSFGIRLDVAGGTPSANNTIVGNLIGTQADGKSPLGNGSDGIIVNESNIDANTIGGTGAGLANTIAFNGGDGVALTGSGRGVTVEGNRIYSNTGLGISISGAANENLSAPSLTAATPQANGSVQVTGTVGSSNSTIDFYANAACDSSGNGEGARWLGSIFVPSSGSFDTGASPSPQLSAPVGPGEVITATATDGLSDTSTFSDCVSANVPTFVVNTASDVPATCTASACSLRTAIAAANAAGGGRITFAIAASGVQTITIDQSNGQLPAITVPVTIDGTTEPETNGQPGIVLAASGGSWTPTGLQLNGGQSTVRGLILDGWSTAIQVGGTGNTIAGNWIGLTSDGAAGFSPGSNPIGVAIGSSNNIVGGLSAADRNVIAGSDTELEINVAGSTGNVIEGNYLGTNVSGSSVIGTSGAGVVVDTAGNEQIGGTAPGAGNVIASASSSAIELLDSSGNTIEGNLLGVDATGSTVLGDTIGVWLNGNSNDNTIGAVGAGANLLAGSAAAAIELTGGTGNTIAGNFIGTELGGGSPFATGNPNAEGVRAGAGPNTFVDNTVDYSAGQGFELGTGPFTISGNSVDGNGGAGLDVGSSPGTVISGNDIRGNGGDGIAYDPSSPGVTIRQNTIDVNTGLGIDVLNGQPVQTAPASVAAEVSGTSLHITGSVTGAVNTSETVDLFASPNPDPSGFGEGNTYLGSTTVTANGQGVAAIDVMVPAGNFGPTDWVSATATSAALATTSGFSQSVQITPDLGSGTTVRLTPVADTFVAHDAAVPTADGNNYSTLDYSDVYGGTLNSCIATYRGTSYTLMKFDLSSIPAGATITSAYLDAATRAGWAQDGDPAAWALFVADDSWTEGGVNWLNRPSDGTLSVGSAAYAGESDIRASDLALGAAPVFRSGCAQDPDQAGIQGKIFPSTADQFPRTVAQQEAAFASRVQTEAAGDGKLSLELWEPVCMEGEGTCGAGGEAYWARFFTTRAAQALWPKLIVTYAAAGPPPTATVNLSTTATNVPAGAAQVKLSDVPASAFLGSATGPSSSPLGSIPLGSIPLGSIPLGSIPLGSIPLGSIGLNAAQTLLGSVALSTIPLAPPKSWAALLAGTPFAGLPLQSVTLAQVLGNPTAAGRLAAIPLGSINLSSSPLGSISPTVAGLGATPLGSIPIPPASGEPSGDDDLTRWCTWLSGPPLNCTAPSSLTNTSVISAALAGAPLGSIPLGSIPLGSIPLGSIPLGSIPLGSIPLGSITVARVNIAFSPLGSIPLGSINLASVPLGSIPLASISPLSAVFSCSPSCPAGGTLAGHIADLKAGATLTDLITNTAPGTLNGYSISDLVNSLPATLNLTYADVLALLLDPGTLNWESLDLQKTAVAAYATSGGTVPYQATFSLAGGTTGATYATKLDVKLPPGFLVVPGSSDLRLNGGEAPVQPGDPTVLSDGTLEYTVNASPANAYVLSFVAHAGLGLGLTAATASVTPAGGIAAAAPTPAAVTVGDTFESNDTPATAKPVAGDSFYLSYLTSKSDIDYYTLPIPAAGTRVTFHLSHLPADYDLVVYGPAGAQQLRPSQPGTPPLDGAGLPDTGFGTTHATDPLAPQTLSDVALAPGLPVFGTSTLRGTENDDVAVVSDGEPGVYTIQVSGFDGATSDQPYMLRTETTPPAISLACAPRVFTGTGTVAPALVTTAPGQAASDVNTLFVVDDQQLGSIYGPAGAGVVTKLNAAATLSGFANAGFPAAVVHVDANTAVRSAFAAWNACPADWGKANTTMSSVASVIDTVRQTYPNVEYLVLVGGDDAIPFARIDDLTTVSTESGYAETFPSTTALGGSLAAAKVLSDDPYGTTAPIPFLNRQLDVPDLVTGRLVETPANINAQLDAFIGGVAPGHLQPATALTTGYDFLSDGATAVSSALGTVAGGAANQTSISDTWTKGTLLGLLLPTNGLTPAIVSLNAHASHNQFKPAAGPDLLSASEIAAATQTFGGRLILSMGCHAGLSVLDAFVPSNNLDWAQLFAQKGAAAYVANTGFGYGDTNTIAYSEELNRLFAVNAVGGYGALTGTTLTLGEALTVAKQAYKGNLGIVGAYDEKAMAELEFYGLPMYRLGGTGIPAPIAAATATTPTPAVAALTAAPAAAPAAVPPTSFPTDPATGLHAEAFSADRTFGAATSTARGSFYTGTDGVFVEHFRPIEPKAIRPVTIDQGHGALLTELTSNDVPSFDPVYARPTVDSSSTEPEVQFDDLAFPSKLQSLTTFRRLRATQQQVVLAQGQFFAANASDGSGSGTQRLFTHEAGEVLSSPSTDYAPPVFSTLAAQVAGSSVVFAVDVTDRDGTAAGSVKRVLAAYQDASGPAWHFVDLVQSAAGSSRWSGAGPLSGTQVQFFVQAVDANGNVGVSTNKGFYYKQSPPPPPPTGGVVVATAATPPPTGWFDGGADVVVTVNGQVPAPGTATLSVDGGPQQPYTGAVRVTGDGVHTATAETAGGSATTTFLIDSGPPAITVAQPPANGAVALNSSATPVFSCADAGIGVQTCLSTGSTFTTSALGFHTFTVSATDKLGKASTTTVTYDVIRITTPAAGTTYPRSTPANADFGCGSGTCTARVTKPGGAVVTVSNGAALPTDLQGSYTFAVTNTSGPNTATLSRTYTVGPPTSLGGKFVFMRLGNIWSINPDGTGAKKLTSGLTPIDSQPVRSPDGTRILFARQPSLTAPRQLWVMDADGQNQLQLTSSGDNTAPAWSPDGTKVAFQSTRPGSKGYDVWVASWNPAVRAAPLGNYVDLTNAAGDDVAPAWSPASVGKLAFSSNRTSSQFDIYTMKTDGTAVTRLTTDPNVDLAPTWSPDGAKIAFTSNRSGANLFSFEIYSMSSTGGSQTRLTKLLGDDLEPYWLDTNRIVFSSTQLLGLGIVPPSGAAATRIPNTILGDLSAG